jgi:hypothetical protein
MWSVQTAREHGDILFDNLMETWQRLDRGDMSPLAFAFLTSDGGEDECVVLPQISEMPKEVIPVVLRMFASDFDARFIALSACATILEGREPDEVEAWYASGKRLADHPEAKDCLILTIDGIGLSVCMRAWWDGERMCREVLDNHGAVGCMTNLSGRLGEN